MINILAYIVLAAFVVRTIRNILYQLFLWQNKEYRLDMLKIYLGTKAGKRILFGTLAKLKFILLAIFIISLLFEVNYLASLVIWIFGLVLIVEAYRNLVEFLTGFLPMPRFTPKVVVILLFTLLFQLTFVLTSSPRFAMDLMPFLDKLLALAIMLQVGALSLPARMRDSLLEFFAFKKMTRLDSIQVIGITGSYGKSTAKELIYELVKNDFKTVKTKKNINKPVGIAKLILKEVDNSTQLLILEAAADKHHGKNQLQRIADMLADKLSVAVITGINQQHLALFKSKQEIAAVKYSLVSSLNDKGVAIFKVDNSAMRSLVKRAKSEDIKTILCGTDKRLFAYAEKIRLSDSDSQFRMVLGKNKAKIKTKLLGKANVEGIVVAATVAYQLGVSWSKIRRGIDKLIVLEPSLRVIKKRNLTLIDDTYTANPDGVMSALDYLAIYKETKIFVLNPLAELGKDSEFVHENIAKYAEKIVDVVILTNDNYNDIFQKALGKSKGRKIEVIVRNKNNAKDYIQKHYKGKKVILFEGREAGAVLESYLS